MTADKIAQIVVAAVIGICGSIVVGTCIYNKQRYGVSDLYIPAETRKIHNDSYDGVHKEAKEAYYAVKNQTIESLTPKEIKEANKKIHENTIHFINGCKARGITSSQGILNKAKFEKGIAVSTPKIYRECRNGIGIIGIC